MSNITFKDGDVNVSLQEPKSPALTITIANGLFYTNENGSPLVVDGANTYMVKEDGIRVEVNNVEVDVQP